MNLVKSNPKLFFPSVMEELFKPEFMGAVQGQIFDQESLRLYVD